MIFSSEVYLDKKWNVSEPHADQVSGLYFTRWSVHYKISLYLELYKWDWLQIWSKGFSWKQLDCHHFDLITWLMYALQTGIQVFNRLVCKLKTRPVVHLTNLHFISRCTSGEKIKFIAHVNLEIWVYGIIYRPALKTRIEQLVEQLHKTC